MDLNAALSRSVLVIKNVTDQDAGLLEHLQYSANCYLKARATQLSHSLIVTRIHNNANDRYALLGFEANVHFAVDDDLFIDLLEFCLALVCEIARLNSIPISLAQGICINESELLRKMIDTCSQDFRCPLPDHLIYFGFDQEMSESLLILGKDDNSDAENCTLH